MILFLPHEVKVRARCKLLDFAAFTLCFFRIMLHFSRCLEPKISVRPRFLIVPITDSFFTCHA